MKRLKKYLLTLTLPTTTTSLSLWTNISKSYRTG
jgi:hypothetical protein